MVFHPAAAIISQMLNVKTQNLNLQKKQKKQPNFHFHHLHRHYIPFQVT